MVLSFEGSWRGPKDLGTATLGTAWTTLGTARIGASSYVGAYLKWTINDSTNLRYRFRAMYEAGGDRYCFAVRSRQNSEVLVEDRYFEENVDEDGCRIVEFQLGNCVPWVVLEASVGTAGGTAATIDDCHLIAGL